jgi:hypothetical protein
VNIAAAGFEVEKRRPHSHRLKAGRGTARRETGSHYVRAGRLWWATTDSNHIAAPCPVPPFNIAPRQRCCTKNAPYEIAAI